jgi:hypothetical protein
MKTEETKGPLTYDPNWDEADDYSPTILDQQGNVVADDGSASGEYGVKLNGANARRLVACWNRLTQFTTEQIEDLGYDLAVLRAAAAIGEAMP